MKNPIKIDTTLQITIDDKTILVSSLPEPLRNEIATYDVIRQRANDAALEYDIMMMAMKKKMEMIHISIQQLIAVETEKTNAKENNSN